MVKFALLRCPGHELTVFILLFEALAMALIEREVPVNRVAEMLKVNAQRVWILFNYWISKAKAADNP
jgi:hypothetical protein